MKKYTPEVGSNLPSLYKLQRTGERLSDSSLIRMHVVNESSEFFILNINDQIQRICRRLNKYCCPQRHENNVLSDITCGSVYQAQHPTNISLIVSVDGIPVNNSGNKSFWPVWASIVELPIRLRSSFANMILCGLWYGQGKPNWENLFPDIESQLREVVKRPNVQILCLVCDLPAKASILNMRQYNGFMAAHTATLLVCMLIIDMFTPT